MPTKRIGLITTINSNIGDDFIRDGIVQILRHVYSGFDVQFISINKHRPFTVYPPWHPLRWLQGLDDLPRGRSAAETFKARTSRALHRLGGSRFDKMDAIVHCGAPVMWPGCHRSLWASALWEQVVARLSDRIAVLTLAAGSAYPWQVQPKTVSDASDATFLLRVIASSRAMTARDELASRLAQSLGASVPTIPCSAFVVGRRFETPKAHGNGIVLFNYMHGGGHWGWGQAIDEDRWMTTAQTLMARLSRRHQVAFLCHNQQEYEAAASLNAELPRFLPMNIESYFSLISRCKAAIVNRIHAAVAMAGLGIPSIAVGTDTRMLMLAPLGLPYRYVADVDAHQLEDQLESAVMQRNEERERLVLLRDATWNQYVDTVIRATTQ